ncbi:NAD(P)H-dependent glycerol-3-phosphate dehydrogenase [candidate division GN15 bacterium]|nr:NAD(P)H-dependent glycerol-3-phosphate dehydrogenase [candidate division GN15 bacterium]
MAKRVTILGAGSWGMAMAAHLDRHGHTVTLWEFDERALGLLQSTRAQPDKLPDFRLAESIDITGSLNDAVGDCELLLITTPAQFVRNVLTRVDRNRIRAEAVVNLAKGVENNTLKRMSEVIADETGLPAERIITISGPSHAEEVALDLPTTVVAAGPNEALVTAVQEEFSGGNFRVYYCDDLVGVELGGSLKNIIAIAAGIADGLGMGDNAKGALITRGLAEITRLGVAMGAAPETFAGLSGIGDLVTTCFSRHSRNRSVGDRIGRGETLDDVLASMSMVAEGVATCRSGKELAIRYDVEMPITAQTYRVLFDHKAPGDAVADLMGRSLKAEIWQ